MKTYTEVEWDGFHAHYCEQYEVKNPPEDADCQCPDWMVEQRTDEANAGSHRS